VNEPDRDDEILERLRAIFERIDPVPPEVTEFASAAFDWRRVDAELAELLADSALETEATSLTRSGGSGGRRLGFRSFELEIDAELTVDGDACTLLGQLAPAPTEATVEVQAADGTSLASAATDSLGRFRLAFEAAGRIRLRVLRVDPPGLPVETSWLSVR
jgi:hypothetical protein